MRFRASSPVTAEIIKRRYFMDSDGWTIGLVSTFIAVGILTAVIVAFSMLTWVLGNV